MPISRDTSITPTEAVIEGNADDALVARNLDHLLAVADGGTVYPTKAIDNSVLAIMLTKVSGGDISDFNNSTDSLEMLSDKLGGFSGDGGAAQDDSVKASLDLAHTDLDTIIDDAKKFDEAALSGTPTASSLATFIATGGTALGTALPASTSLYDAVKGTDNVTNRQAGKMQIFATTIDLHQAAASYDLATGTTQPVAIEAVTLVLPDIDVSDDAAITSVSVQTDHTTPQVFITAAEGAKANLDAEAQLGSSLTAPVYLHVGHKVQLTIGGGTADADPTTCQVIILYRAVVSGGYLA